LAHTKRRTDEQTGPTKLIVAFSNPANAPKKSPHVPVRLKSGKNHRHFTPREVYEKGSFGKERYHCLYGCSVYLGNRGCHCLCGVCGYANAPEMFYPADVFKLLQPIMLPLRRRFQLELCRHFCSVPSTIMAIRLNIHVLIILTYSILFLPCIYVHSMF
jgi:hypothetical protein